MENQKSNKRENAEGRVDVRDYFSRRESPYPWLEKNKGIGFISIKKGTPDALIKIMERRLFDAGILAIWDGDGFLVIDRAAAEKVLERIEIELEPDDERQE